MNNDLISREALRKAFHERIWHFDKSSWDEANAIIDNASPVKAFTEEDMAGAYNEGYMCGSREAEKARKQGEWIDCKEFPYLANCSNCGYQMDTHEEHGYFKFCPNCGADMRKGGADNE